ncbi:hypothetical protein [Streptomyces acidiscabies]|uniref:hypothetical protein n=1 Tax=Streptomyces acidiscabies TaxID=42234 RepID=UPI000A8E77FF|nr:hypothetical protein [Streptomyces acidiscabies]
MRNARTTVNRTVLTVAGLTTLLAGAWLTLTWQPSSPDPVWTSPRCPPWTRRTSTMEATAKMPYDFSPARVRYEERDIELLHSADQNGDTPRTC